MKKDKYSIQDIEEILNKHSYTEIDTSFYPDFTKMAKEIMTSNPKHYKQKSLFLKRRSIVASIVILLVVPSLYLFSPETVSANNFLTAIDWFKAHLNGQGSNPEDTKLQKYVWNKMFTAIHNYKTVQGNIDYNLGMHVIVDFGIQQGNQNEVKGYEDLRDQDSGQHDKVIQANSKYVHIMYDKNEYIETNINPQQDDILPKHLTIPNMFSLNDHLLLGPSHTLTNPKELLHSLLDNFNTWHVINSSTAFGRKTYKLSGTISDIDGKKYKGATNFNMTVDQESGVVFDVEFLSQDSKVLSYIRMNSVIFDKELPPEKLNQTIPPGFLKIQ